MLSPAVCRKWRVPAGSFSIFPKCFFPALPSLADAWEVCDASSPVPDPVPAYRGQFRYQVFKNFVQRSCASRIVYYLAPDEDVVERIVEDILTITEERVCSFWSRYEDPAEVLRSLQSEEDQLGRDSEGLVDIGAKGSHIRLIYTGFAALWMEDYELALTILSECRRHPKLQPSQRPGVFDTRPVLACIDRGIARAREELAQRSRQVAAVRR
jgi:hypothetical protein